MKLILTLFKRNLLIFLFLISLISFSSLSVSKHNAVVVTRHHLATEVGSKILLDGGNAFDAAISVAFALAVVNPSAGNIGGGGFALLYDANKKSIESIDYRERAPIKAKEDMFLDENGNVIKGLSTSSFLASGIPGTVDGMYKIHKKYGSLPIKKLISPAIDLAEKGFILSKFQAEYFNDNRDKFSKNPETKKVFVKENLWKKGDLFFQEDLAKTLKRISKFGRDEFYSGETAKKIINYFQKNGGIFTKKDFMNYQSSFKPSLCSAFFDFKVCSMSLPSSGGIVLSQALNILENFNLTSYEHNSLEYNRLLTEAMRFSFADRSEFLGDGDFNNFDISRLTSKKYAKSLSTIIKNSESKILINTPGEHLNESEETTHFSIIDSKGNAVSNTYTLNTAYGSGIIAKGTGILMNNEMDDFSIKPGFPNFFGLVGSEANKVESKKAPLSSMTPTIVFQRGKPYLITGSPGGSTIISTDLQLLLNILIFDMEIDKASTAKRIHHQWKPDILFIEKGKNIKNINQIGFDTVYRERIGETHSILLNEEKYEGFADFRRPDGKAISVH
jgi:gamma-glutamyltranspeptidase/glutathione hydrolase